MSLILEELPINGLNPLMDLKSDLIGNNHLLWVRILPTINSLVGFTTNLNRTWVPLGWPYLIGIYNYPQPNRQLPFLATLDLPDLSKLINDPIQHNPFWPTIPVKFPSDIPKFEGKKG